MKLQTLAAFLAAIVMTACLADAFVDALFGDPPALHHRSNR